MKEYFGDEKVMDYIKFFNENYEKSVEDLISMYIEKEHASKRWSISGWLVRVIHRWLIYRQFDYNILFGGRWHEENKSWPAHLPSWPNESGLNLHL